MRVLSELKVGETGVLVALDLPESVQNHLMHMGFVPDALVTALRRAPAGDPTVYRIDGFEIALRHETADAISVRVGPVRAETRDVHTRDIQTRDIQTRDVQTRDVQEPDAQLEVLGRLAVAVVRRGQMPALAEAAR